MRVISRCLASIVIAVLFSSPLLKAGGQLVSAWPTSVSGSETPDGKRIMAKLNSILIDKRNFETYDLTKILPYLTQRSKELDPEHIGVKFILQGPYQPHPWSGMNREVTQSFTDVPLIEVLWYTCQATHHDFKIEDNAVIVFPAVIKSQSAP
jgi:hypothetical protein